MAAKLPNMDGTFGILYVFLNSIEIMVYFTVILFDLPAEIATKLDRAPIITFEVDSNFVQKSRQKRKSQLIINGLTFFMPDICTALAGLSPKIHFQGLTVTFLLFSNILIIVIMAAISQIPYRIVLKK